MPATLDDTVRHQVMLERLKVAEAREFNRLLPIIQQQVDDLLARMRGRKLSDLDRGSMNAQLRLLRDAQRRALTDAQDKALARLRMLAEYEAEFEVESLRRNAQQAGVNLAIAEPAGTAAWALANTRPLSATGDLLAPWVKDMTAAEVDKVNKVILRGFAEGWTNDELRNILSGTAAMQYTDGLLSKMGKHNATIVRTAVQHVASASREATWDANRDIIQEVKWVSTLDSRTSPQCRTLDGQVFPLDEGPRPPIHPNCRSTTIPVLKGKLKVLSEDRTRASADGPVDGDLTYYEWLKGQSAEFQRDVLGATKYKIFTDPSMTAEKFAKLQLGGTFQPLTLEQMSVKEKLMLGTTVVEDALLTRKVPDVPFHPLPRQEAVDRNRNDQLGMYTIQPDHQQAIRRYTGSEFRLMNNALRYNTVDQLSDDLLEDMDLINAALETVPLAHDLNLYRSMELGSWAQESIEKYVGKPLHQVKVKDLIGWVYQDPAFQSWTLDPNLQGKVTQDADTTVSGYMALAMHARKGQRGIGIMKYSQYDFEKEVLRPGGKFKVVGVEDGRLLIDYLDES